MENKSKKKMYYFLDKKWESDLNLRCFLSSLKMIVEKEEKELREKKVSNYFQIFFNEKNKWR